MLGKAVQCLRQLGRCRHFLRRLFQHLRHLRVERAAGGRFRRNVARLQIHLDLADVRVDFLNLWQQRRQHHFQARRHGGHIGVQYQCLLLNARHMEMRVHIGRQPRFEPSVQFVEILGQTHQIVQFAVECAVFALAAVRNQFHWFFAGIGLGGLYTQFNFAAADCCYNAAFSKCRLLLRVKRPVFV